MVQGRHVELLRLVSQNVGLLGQVIGACALEVDIRENFGTSAQLRQSGEVGFVFLSEKCVRRGEGGVENLQKVPRGQSPVVEGAEPRKAQTHL